MHRAEFWSETIKPPLKIYPEETEGGRARWLREKGKSQRGGLGERKLSGFYHRVDYSKDTSLHPSLWDTYVHGCSDSVHFNSSVTSSYNSCQWVFEQTLVFRSVFRASWQAHTWANWPSLYNYRSNLRSHSATANLWQNKPKSTLSKCHLNWVSLQARHSGAF